MGPVVLTSFFIDGFNLYHSLQEAHKVSGRNPRWLDVASLCRASLPRLQGQGQFPAMSLGTVEYFTAYAHHADEPGNPVVARHQTYLAALQPSGVTIHLGRFKRRYKTCKKCRQTFLTHEEKETDVAIGVHSMGALCHNTPPDCVVFVTGDTDLLPAVKGIRAHYPHVKVCFLFPFERHHLELEQVADASIKLRPRDYFKHQFADPTPAGISKPAGW